VTRQPPSKRSTWEPIDETLDAATGVTIHRLPMDDASSAREMIPGSRGEEDPFVQEVCRCVRELEARQRVDVITLTMPPYGMSPIVAALKDRTTAKLLVDLQDPWALDGAASYRNRAQWKRNERWMQRTLGIADGVVANTPEARTQLLARVGGVTPDRIVAINNGCSLKEFEGPLPPRPETITPDCFHLVHTGTLHSAAFERIRGPVGRLRKFRNHRAEPIRISGRTAYHLLKAIDRLRRKGEPRMQHFRLSLVGLEDGPTRRIVEASPVRDLVQLVGFVPYQESLAWIRHADALFVPLFDLPAGHRSRIIPSKTYEYLASGRPLLGALPEGDARDLVESYPLGVTAGPCDEEALARGVLRVMELSEGGRVDEHASGPWIEPYDWRRLCERFFHFADELAYPGVGSDHAREVVAI